MELLASTMTRGSAPLLMEAGIFVVSHIIFLCFRVSFVLLLFSCTSLLFSMFLKILVLFLNFFRFASQVSVNFQTFNVPCSQKSAFVV